MRTLLLLLIFVLLGAVGAYIWKALGDRNSTSSGGAVMGTGARTDETDWRNLLQELSDQAIADKELRPYLDPKKVKARWMGEPPATDQEIAAAETRLGAKLPPSYRAFLKVSNGWSYPNSFVVRLAGTSEIGWTRDKQPDLIEGWKQGAVLGAAQFGSAVRGPEDDLAQTLMINRPDILNDDAWFMLNPQKRNDGEMEAWFFSNWNPGAEVYPSFWHLMVGMRDSNAYVDGAKPKQR